MADEVLTPLNTLSGKAALITGGASGIGYATAELFLQAGARVVIADVNPIDLEAAAARLNAAHAGRVYPVSCDAADMDSCWRVVEFAVEQLGHLDILCNIAGVLAIGATEQFPEERWQRVLAVNLSGPFYLSKNAIPHLLKTRGCIVNVASTAGTVGVPFGAAYSASKAGVIGLTRAMAVEYARRGVRVNALCPGYVATPMTANNAGFGADLDLSLLPYMSPLTGVGSKAREMAEAIAFLASAPNATGTILTVDGGQTAI